MAGTSFFAEAKYLVPSPDSATYNLYNSPTPALAANGAATLSMLGFSPANPQPADTADFQTANGSVDNVTNSTTPSASTAFELGGKYKISLHFEILRIFLLIAGVLASPGIGSNLFQLFVLCSEYHVNAKVGCSEETFCAIQ